LEDDHLRPLARAIAVYRSKIGERLGHVRDAARAALEGVRPDRVEAVVKLLDDAATYEWPRGREQALRRLRVFEAAARSCLRTVLPSAPEPLDEAVAFLYADYPEFHRLAGFPPDYSPEALRADYDLAQAQALLYDAALLEVEARRDFKHIVQYAHLSRLLHRIERTPGRRYRLVFDGPNSILRHTHAYGVDLAKFLAALVQARDWRMRAEIALRRGWAPVTFSLSSEDALRSNVPAPRLFDSQLEEKFARKFGPARDGWHLHREALILEAGEALIVPDFLFVHKDGTEVGLEIVGYWTPEYLKHKFDKLSRAGGVNVIVAVRRAWALKAASLHATALPFRTGILMRDLMPRLEAFRGGQRAGD
jgi:uncharacterized protein